MKYRGTLVWWHTPVMPVFKKLRKKNEFEARLTYIVKPSLKIKRRKKKKGKRKEEKTRRKR